MTKKFIYTDDLDNKLKEASAFIESDFTYTSLPNSPVITGPGGQLHPSVIPASVAAYATSLVISRTASGAISRGDAVRAFSLGFVTVAEPDMTVVEASVLGLALSDALDGESVDILVLGIISDSIFNIFSVNSHLYLDELGGITDVRRTTGFLTYIGKCLGGGEVLVNVSAPTQLGG